MEFIRRIYFPENDCTIITGLCPNGEFGAYLESDDGRVRGYGHSRLAAMADLMDVIGRSEGEENPDAQVYAIDHERDLRKHGAV